MSHLPGGLRTELETRLEEVRGRGGRITAAKGLGGGCISPAARIELDDGEAFFVKWEEGAPGGRDAFEAEAEGLRALAAAGPSLRIPEVIGVGAGGGAPAFLLLEFVPPGAGDGNDYGRRLGRGLAELHRSDADPAHPDIRADVHGWRRDNRIGALPQGNAPLEGWAAFWRDRRLAPQLEMARSGGHLAGRGGAAVEKVVERCEEALAGAGADGPSLLHGDLWGGNAYPGPNGEPVLIDPAVYRGHREVDLAMSELFGGFPASFLDAYHEAWPVDAVYPAVRRPLYQLYYLLVHVNLFGAGYVGRSVAAAKAVLQAI